MIPSPKLDDRKFKDIVDEAIGLIPRYAPEWTNHNPADPGITLLELAAWMTDLLVHPVEPGPREELRRVPEPARHQAARAARGQGAPAVQARPRAWRCSGCRRGSQAQTPQAGDDSTVTFETAREVGDHLGRARSLLLVRSTNTYADNSRYANPDLKALRGLGSRCSPGRSASIASCTCRIRASPASATRR
jgi:hypothetical protein